MLRGGHPMVTIASNMNRFLMIITMVFFIVGCGGVKYIPTSTVEKVVVKDSLVYRDSIIYIPQERIVEIVPQIDTLFMDIEVAESKAYLDTTNMLLRGELRSKKKEIVKYQTIIEYRDRIDTVYITEPQPYEVIKKERYIPSIFWWSLIGNIIVILYLVFRLYLKIKVSAI